MAKNYYEVLGITKDASQDDVKRAYRKLALKWHPDKNPDNPAAEERFKEASEAYSILGDKQKRSEYDMFGQRGPSREWDPFAGFRSHFGSDIFEEFFGRRHTAGQSRQHAGQHQHPRGADISITLNLSFMESMTGTSRDIVVDRNAKCQTCDATGGEGAQTCNTCKGAGQIQFRQGQMLSLIHI